MPSECQAIVNQLGKEHGLPPRVLEAGKTNKKLYAGNDGFVAVGSLLM